MSLPTNLPVKLFKAGTLEKNYVVFVQGFTPHMDCQDLEINTPTLNAITDRYGVANEIFLITFDKIMNVENLIKHNIAR